MKKQRPRETDGFKRLPAQNIDEFIATAKADPGRYTFATNGLGTSTHLIGALIMTSLGVELVDVPYAGAARAMTDLIAGMVDSNIEALSVAVPNIAAGKYRALAAPVAERLPQLPDVPTFAELGYPDVVAENWFALFAPAETPDEIVTALHAAIAEISADEAYTQRMYDMGNPVRTSTPEELDALMVKEVDRWSGIIDAIGLEAQ